jgi:dephospho-CoA kinase
MVALHWFLVSGGSMTRFGLTGNMGCGKSTVASMLSVYADINVVDCDGLAKEVIIDPRYRTEIIDALQKNVFVNKELDTGAIANIVFGDPIRKAAFEKVIGPRMWQKVEEATASKGIHVVEMAYLFEKHIEHRFDAIIAATCSKSTQMRRLREDRHMSEAAIAGRLKYQLPQQKIIDSSYFVIDTECTFSELEVRVATLSENLRSWKGVTTHETRSIRG